MESVIVSDNLDYGFQNKIPLWIFGFLYWFVDIQPTWSKYND